MPTKAKATKSANPAYPDADPTAPGGMSQKALAMELRDKHGWTPAQVREAFPNGLKDWAKMIDAVIEERRNRERELTLLADELEDAERPVAMCPITNTGCPEFETCVEYGCVNDDGEADLTDGATASTEHPEFTKFFDRVLEDPEAREAFEAAEARADEAQAMFGDMPDPEDFDPDDLMAELNSARDEAVDAPIQHGLLTKLPGVLDYIFDGHMGAGPSASERWMHCTASLGASRAFLETLTPNQQEQWAGANLAARQGTTAHAAAEVEALAVLGAVDQAEVEATLLELSVNPATEDEAYDEEMAEYITEYVDLVRTYAQDRGNDHVLIEQTVSAVIPLTQALPNGEDWYEVRGSGDCIVLPTPEDPTLVVDDLKYGDGIDVDVDENPQVRIYALGALGLLVDDEGNLITPVETITYHIVQPRLGGIKTWSEPLADLLQWRDEVLAPALTAALLGPKAGATFAPSESACQFCPARGGCPALAETRLTQAADLFDVIVEAEFTDGPGAFPETTLLTDTRLGELLSQIKGLTSIYEDLKAEAQRRLYRGDAVPGWGLVNYSPPRKWSEDAAEILADVEALWEKKMVSAPQAMALVKKGVEGVDGELIEKLVVKPDKVPVVAPEGDRRSKWVGRPPEAMFDDESEAQS